MQPTMEESEIKKKYRAMALKTHPDKGGSSALFRAVHEAAVKILKAVQDWRQRFPTK